MNTFLIVNVGSSSKKYALYQDLTELVFLHYEKVGDVFHLNTREKGVASSVTLNTVQGENPLAHAFDLFIQGKYLSDAKDLSGIGLRIVAPGSYFQSHKKIDAEYLERLRSIVVESPLHLDPVLHEIKLLQTIAPTATLYGLSDSAFHAQIPGYAKSYAVDTEARVNLDVSRFGYHGFSFVSVVQKLHARGASPSKVVVCHLGSGASIAAIQNGVSIDTSMGYSPLEGLIMGTRVGDIDAGALIHIAKEKKYSIDDLEKYLYIQCGLLGLSGSSSDLRDLLKLEAEHDAGAKLAIESFIYRIQKYIGAYTAALGGIDTLVFTGTIAERSAVIRARITSNLGYLGIAIDASKNNDTSHEDFLEIHSGTVPVVVFASNETGAMASSLHALISA